MGVDVCTACTPSRLGLRAEQELGFVSVKFKQIKFSCFVGQLERKNGIQFFIAHVAHMKLPIVIGFDIMGAIL